MKAVARGSGRISQEAALKLWSQYRETGDAGLRNRLVLTFAPLVKYLVYRKIRELPARCEVEDFISAGLESLIDSIERYDPEKGATLEQYAWTRIHGAILDELRRQDWAPRSLRRWERDAERARREFVGVHGRQPTREELADSLATTVDEVRRRQAELAVSDVGSLNTLVVTDDDTDVECIETLMSDDATTQPEEAVVRIHAKEKFRRAFQRLPRREREVAVMLYLHNMTLREIGDVLGVSESRVCQIHGALKGQIRRALAAEAQLFSEVA